MGNQKLRLTYEQVAWLTEQTQISDPQKALEYFADLMRQEGIKPRFLPQVIEKMMQRMRKQK